MSNSFPPGVQVVNLTGRYLAPDGTPLQGYLTFTPPPAVILAGADTITATPAKAVLDDHGEFSVFLVATDNSAMSPTGWAYKVQVNLVGVAPPMPSFHVLLPHATSPVDIADITPTTPYPGNYLPVVGAQGPAGPTGPPGPAAAPHRLCVFYAAPIYVTTPGVSVGPQTVENSAQRFAHYDYLVLGAGLQDVTHPDHASTVAIIARMRQLNPRVRVYGYCDLGMTGSSSHAYSIGTLQVMIDNWAATGADQIFLDQAGYAYGVTRARLNTVLDYIHQIAGRGAMVNDADADAVMGSALNSTYNPAGTASHMGPVDGYLLESWIANTVPAVGYVNGYNTTAEIRRRGDLAAAYRTALGVQLFTANIVELGRLTADQIGTYFKVVETVAQAYGLTGYDGASDIYYSAASAVVDPNLQYDVLYQGPSAGGVPQWNSAMTEVSRPDIGITAHLDPTSPGIYWYQTGETALRVPYGPAGGDLAGLYPTPTVHRINGVTVSGTPTSGQVPTATSGTAASWATPATIPTTLPPSGTASGDLSGAYPAPAVHAVQGIAVTAGAPSAGQVLTAANGTTAAWSTLPAAPTTLPPSGAAGGDLANSYPNPRVQGVTGVQVSNSPAATAGAVLTANSSSSASWTVPTTPRLDQLASPTAAVGLNAQKIIFLANGSASTDAAAFGQIPVAGTGSANFAAGNDTRITGAAQKSANLSDLASASTARTSLGLGGAAVLNVGTTTGTVAAGDDARVAGAVQIGGDISGTVSAPKVAKIDGATLAGFNPGSAGVVLTATSTTTAGWGPLPTLNAIPQPTGDVNMNNHGLLNLGNTTVGFGGGSISFYGAAQITKPTTGAVAHPTDPVVVAILSALSRLGLITDATV